MIAAFLSPSDTGVLGGDGAQGLWGKILEGSRDRGERGVPFGKVCRRSSGSPVKTGVAGVESFLSEGSRRCLAGVWRSCSLEG